MNKKTNILLISLAITIGVFVYLTVHHFSVKLGLSGNAICSISDKLNCDAAATSSFSELFGIPIAVLGGIFHLFLLGLVLFLKFNWIERSIYALTTTRLMLILAAVTSVVMGLISLISIKVLCPFCMATYALSIINLFLGWNIISTDEKKNFASFFGAEKSYLIFLIAIPVVSWMVSGMMQEGNGLAEVRKVIPEKIYQWKSSPEYTFSATEGLVKKGDSKVTVVEFADFKCPHCKTASATIDSFLKGNPQVNFVFKPFPLDGNCNAAISTKGDGSRCTLAAWALCAEKNEQRGWDMHHWIFKNQEKLLGVSDLKPYLAEIESELKINTTQLTQCSESNETYDLIRRLADEGAKAQVNGTPTIYMNGRKLPYGQFLDVLRSAAAEIK